MAAAHAKLSASGAHRWLACPGSIRMSEGVEPDDTLTYMGLNTLTRQWERIATYGGKFCENFCQSVSRDAMASSMPAIEADGFEILFTVHDEIVTEVPDGPAFNAERLAALMATPPAWATGFPLAAAGFEAPRYRKDA